MVILFVTIPHAARAWAHSAFPRAPCSPDRSREGEAAFDRDASSICMRLGQAVLERDSAKTAWRGIWSSGDVKQSARLRLVDGDDEGQVGSPWENLELDPRGHFESLRARAAIHLV